MDPSQLSNFDPSSFLDATVEGASTARPPLPAGGAFPATLGEPKMQRWANKEGTNAGLKAVIPVEFDVASLPPNVQALFVVPEGGEAIKKIVISDDIMLDVIEINGNFTIDMAPGKNGRLRQYREATNLNSQGQAFNIRMFQGRNILAKIKHDLYEGTIYDKIAAVAKLG